MKVEYKIFLTLFFAVLAMPVFSVEKMTGGVSFDYENTNNKAAELQKKLPDLKKDFMDLNYTIELKPFNMLSDDEVVIKQKPRALKIGGNQIKFTPDNYEISLSTGRAKGKYDETNALETLLKQYPENGEIMYAYAIKLKNDGNYKEALNVADKALEIDPDFALGHFLRADILRNLGDFREAVNEYLYTTQINPLCADAYYNIAKILELLDDRELALDYYKTAYQINPDDNEIRDIILGYYIDL